MNTTRKTTGSLLIAVPLVFAAGYTGLQMTFDYPAILRQPAGDVLIRFAASGNDLHLYWYAMMAAALGMIPASIGLGAMFRRDDGFAAGLVAGFGVLAGLVQAMGLLRWVMLVPSLAASYVAPGATDFDKAMAASLFDAANHYLGMGVGEHLGYFFTALWTFLVAALVWTRWRILALAGLVIGVGVAIGMLEPFGVPVAGTINGISFSLWALWTLVLGVLLLRSRLPLRAVQPQAA